MRYRLLLIVLAGVLVGTPVTAQRTTTYEQITVANSAIGVAAATYANMAVCELRLETAEVRWRVDGTDPTSAVGTPLYPGDVLRVESVVDMRFIKFIRTGTTSGVLNVWCWPRA